MHCGSVQVCLSCTINMQCTVDIILNIWMHMEWDMMEKR